MILENDKPQLFHFSLFFTASIRLFLFVSIEGFAFPKVREKKFFEKPHNLSELWLCSCVKQGQQRLYLSATTAGGAQATRIYQSGYLLGGNRGWVTCWWAQGKRMRTKWRLKPKDFRTSICVQRPPSCTALYKLVKPTFQDASADWG